MTYTPDEEKYVLTLARQILTLAAENQPLFHPNLETLTPALQAERACFVTLREHKTDALRGCTGTLVARNPLAIEVVVTTEQTALHDPRFAPVRPSEVDHLHIEISVLTPMQPLSYVDAHDLIRRLRPQIDGVTLVYGNYRATFLPQVWERVSEPTVFLSMLCQKMGLPSDLWYKIKMQVFTYQSVIIEEPRNHAA